MDHKQRTTSSNSTVGVIVLVILAVIVAAGVLWFAFGRNSESTTEPQSLNGQVTALGDGCSAGQTCSITVDRSKIIITGCAVVPNDPHCTHYDPAKVRVGAYVESTVLKSTIGDYYNLDCDICTIEVK